MLFICQRDIPRSERHLVPFSRPRRPALWIRVRPRRRKRLKRDAGSAMRRRG